MPAITINLTREAHERLTELATRDKRRLYAQAGYLLERILLDVPPRPDDAEVPNQASRAARR